MIIITDSNVMLAFCGSCKKKIDCRSPDHSPLFKSLELPNLRGTIFYGWPGNNHPALFLFSLLVCCSLDKTPQPSTF